MFRVFSILQIDSIYGIRYDKQESDLKSDSCFQLKFMDSVSFNVVMQNWKMT